ncbi:MAG: hypothetical protein U0835_04030 [Isosphaeraceae bacterium]
MPAYRDVSAAVSDAARYRNEAEGYAAERRLTARAEAQARRDSAAPLAKQKGSRAAGQRRAFVSLASAHQSRPDLMEFALLWDALTRAYSGRPKLVLDPRAGGRRNVWLADPERMGVAQVAPAVEPLREPED